MARPKRPFSGVEKIEYSKDKWLLSQTPGGISGRNRDRWHAASHWTYVAHNGVFDPLTYFHILSALMNINPDIELRANNLVAFLTSERPLFRWDVVTVGRILSDITERFEDITGEKNGLLEQGTDYKGNFYRIHHNPETARLAQGTLNDLYRNSEAEMALRETGKRTKDMVSPLNECPTLRAHWPMEVEEAI